MAYRSDVMLALSKAAKVKLMVTSTTLEILKEADDTTSTDDADYYFFGGWKWYLDYPEISTLMDFLDDLEDEEYGFIRVGEDGTDVETYGDTYSFDIYLEHHISSPFD